MRIDCPQCDHSFEATDEPSRRLTCPSCGCEIASTARAAEPNSDAADPTLATVPVDSEPKELAKFQLLELVGRGGFGKVYRARDRELDREVAIKVPDARHWRFPTDANTILEEARNVARLQHPGIVTVYDVGRSDGSYFIVSEFVHGDTLAVLIRSCRPKWQQAATLIARVAEALAYAHTHGVIHRDIKPSNVIVDHQGLPHLTDFGLALRERDDWDSSQTKGGIVGTPSYMSPEQARGEGHRIDGRTDIYSLGVVFYELLTGRRPFNAPSQDDLLTQILRDEPRPPRQMDGRIPRELERICLKAMAKRVTERYTTAADMAEDLWHAIQAGLDHEAPSSIPSQAPTATPAASRESSTPTSDWAIQTSVTMRVRLVPKGLRSFEAEDCDGFLLLLPGARDRDGLPESIRFWKSRIESTEEDCFPIGLVYGPSGCGKSSFVKAGLLPRLADHVTTVFVECTPDDTEGRLLKALRRASPLVKESVSLAQAVAVLRRAGKRCEGKKTLIVLDQFEQWLHVQGSALQTSSLLLALRQVDGAHVQCLVLVRDDFWLSVSRFFAELELSLTQDRNCRVMDLLPLRHARRVLELFGQAYGALPLVHEHISRDQKVFLEEVAEGLSENGMVIPIRLSLIADMMKGRPWTPATLRDVGGTEGIGVTFLEETFNGRGAVPDHRLHQAAARRVLEALLPAKGTEIKGRLRSRRELLEASGYSSDPHPFQRLLQILDRELHLISPTLRVEPGERGDKPERTAEDYYQLTHDYLVPSVREWLYRKRRETWRGRAELLLEERAQQWTRSRQPRFLPSAIEFGTILAGVPRSNFDTGQREMMRVASLRYGTVTSLVVLASALVAWMVRDIRGSNHAQGLVRAVTTARSSELDSLVGHDLPRYRRWADPLFHAIVASEPEDSPRRLRASLALLGADSSQVEYLGDRLLRCTIDEFGAVRTSLKPHATRLTAGLWTTFRDQRRTDSVRFYAGMALAAYQPESPNWTPQDFRYLAGRLVASNPEDQRKLRSYLEPVKDRLIEPLGAVFLDGPATDVERVAAATALTDYARDNLRLLARLACDANPAQLNVLLTAFDSSERREVAITLLREHTSEPSIPVTLERDRARIGRQRAGAAITLLRLGERTAILDTFRFRDDPESLTQFGYGAEPRGVTPKDVLDCLRMTQQDHARYALLLTLGEFSAQEVPEPERREISRIASDWYATDPSSMIHSACGWLLRTWRLENEVEQIDRSAPDYDAAGKREWFVRRIGGHTLTFVVFHPDRFIAGSPESEETRRPMESQKSLELRRAFAVCDREVTRDLFDEFIRDAGLPPKSDAYGASPRHPVVGPTWFEAVSFCRWLTTRAGMEEQDQCYVDPLEVAEDERIKAPQPGVHESRWRSYPKNWPSNLDRKGFRLPTEAEWEYGCRAGTTTSYGFGSDRQILARYACFQQPQTYPAGTLRPNLRGLFDMHGNVNEWCHNWFSIEFDDCIDGPPGGVARTLRGGCYYDNPWDCRTASRYHSQPSSIESNMGLRIVFTLDSEP